MKAEVAEFQGGIDLWLKRADETLIAHFRDIVWKIYLRILLKTPQYTGNAVANWNIGVGAPDYSFGDFGDEAETEVVQGKDGTWSPRALPRHQQGSDKWREFAKRRNKPKLALIKRDTRVFFNNSAHGDTDDGRSTELYLESLQDPAYWAQKLRVVNQPYEIAIESIMVVVEQAGRLQGDRVVGVGEVTIF